MKLNTLFCSVDDSPINFVLLASLIPDIIIYIMNVQVS